MSKTSSRYLSPCLGAVSLGQVTILMIPSGQYLAHDAQPVQRSSYQTNSSPLNLGYCFTRSSGYCTVKGFLVMFFRVTKSPLAISSPYILPYLYLTFTVGMSGKAGIAGRAGTTLTLSRIKFPNMTIEARARGMLMPAMTQRSVVVSTPASPFKKNASREVAARLIKLKGSRNFQERAIIWSRRRRG